MNDLLSQFKPVLDALGVQAWMYPLALAIGIINVYLKGTIVQYDGRWSLAVAALGSIGLALEAAFSQGVGLGPAAAKLAIYFAVALIAETLVALAVEKIPALNALIPKNNQWAKKPEGGQ